MKVEIVERSASVGGDSIAQRLDGLGGKFKVNTEDLAALGSNDLESDWKIWKRVEYRMLEELLEKEGYLIEKVDEDGNCLFRAAARQLFGDQEKHVEVRCETVKNITANK